jgi:hypothetical protein
LLAGNGGDTLLDKLIFLTIEELLAVEFEALKLGYPCTS